LLCQQLNQFGVGLAIYRGDFSDTLKLPSASVRISCFLAFGLTLTRSDRINLMSALLECKRLLYSIAARSNC
jgi:hypothetical protein